MKKWYILYCFRIFVEEYGVYEGKRGGKNPGGMRGGRMGKFGAETGPVLIVGVGVV